VLEHKAYEIGRSEKMATTPTKNDKLDAAESRDPESASRRKKIATKSVLSPSAYLASFSSKLVGTEGDDNAKDSVTLIPSGDIAVNDSNAVVIFDDEDDDAVPPARLLSSLRPTPVKTKKKVVSSSLKKKTNLHLQKRAPTKIKKTPAKKVDAKLNGFWEIERIVGIRKSGSSYEYLVKWKGDYENTWEPQKNLNRSALQEAKELRKEHELRKNQESN
jgi:Chromo (CHRromatin Organisation MOdifier) domain